MNNHSGKRPKNISGTGKNAYRRGSGLGTGPVGNAGGYVGRPKTSARPGIASTNPARRASATRTGGSGIIKLILIALAILLGGGFGVGSLFGGGNGAVSSSLQNHYGSDQAQSPIQFQTQSPAQAAQQSSALYGGNGLFASLNSSSVSGGWDRGSNNGRLDTSVASGAREKRTQILGSGRDAVTVMVYMCGTDLESRSGMATNDLKEMANAKLGGNVNVLVCTGGCSGWKNSFISSSVNQIYQVQSGGMKCLVKDNGSGSMTDPATLTDFIRYCDSSFPANRYELILWDHGGGSVSGFGYDEKNRSSGSMTLPKLSQALSDAGVSFDFIGLDACLMATLETALVLEPYADYMIASEETEPGIGWYYTNWLTQLSSDPSASTLDIGKTIADDFVRMCDSQCRGQKTTLSVTDLAELACTVPDALKNFSTETIELLQSDGFKQVSDARSATREFAASKKTDLIDFVHLATKLQTDSGEALAKALLGAVKYNRTASNMTNTYGLSVYFPYQKVSGVSAAISAYEDIGMDSEYARCIQQFASMEIGGQAVSGGAASPLGSLLGNAPASSSQLATVDISQLLSGLLGGNLQGVSGLNQQNSSFLGNYLDVDRASSYLAENRFDPSALVWQTDGIVPQMFLADEQWALINRLELNVFVDDGEGFIDLGLDDLFELTQDGALKGSYDGSWFAIDEQPVAFYVMDTVYEGERFMTTARIPVMLNDERAELLVAFDNENPDGVIIGARRDYHDGETETVAKSMLPLENGDTIDFLCDYYSYDGEYLDSYCLGERVIYSENMQIGYVYLPDPSAANAVYRFTDIYNQQYWSPVME